MEIEQIEPEIEQMGPSITGVPPMWGSEEEGWDLNEDQGILSRRSTHHHQREFQLSDQSEINLKSP